MRKLLSKLKIGTKLLLFSVVIIITLLSLGIISSIVLKKLSVKEDNIIQSISISDAVFEAKYFLRSDMHIFQELSLTTEKAKFDYWEGEHNFQIQFFNDQIKKINDVFSNAAQKGKYSFNPKILSLTDSIANKYNNGLLPIFLHLKNLKEEEFILNDRFQNDTGTDVRIKEIKNEISQLEERVAQNGLNIITTLDKAKVLTQDIVSNLQKDTTRIIRVSLNRTIVIVVAIFLIICVVTFYLYFLISAPVIKIKSTVDKLSQGEHPSNFIVKSKDEFGEIQTAINKLIDSLRQISDFSNEIGRGNYNSEFTPSSKKDVLGNSLLEMRDSLKKAEIEHKEREEEEQKRKWVNEGLALFGDVLRQSHDNIKELSFNIIINLINYLKANQGGLFIKNNDNKDDVFFELIATYAYNRKKYNTKRIELGEGLIGTCAIERKTIYLTDIPDNYVQITSGLGGSNPKSILIAPLKMEDEVLGVVEIASFNTFEKYEIEFIEKIGQNIASTLATERVNERTSQLLEKTQQQAEEMAAQEEEMRQNMEELQATQEESARKSIEMEGFINALNSTSYVTEYDLDGRITYVNDAYLNLLGITREEAIGSHHSENIDFTEEQEKEYQKFWQDLKSGIVKKEKTTIIIKNKAYLFLESYSPIYNEEGDIYKILKIANDISEYIEK